MALAGKHNSVSAAFWKGKAACCLVGWFSFLCSLVVGAWGFQSSRVLAGRRTWLTLAQRWAGAEWVPMEQWVLTQGCQGECGGLYVYLCRCPGGCIPSPLGLQVTCFRNMSQFVASGRVRSGLLEGPEQRMSWPSSPLQNKTLLWRVGKGVTALGHVSCAN